MRKERPGRFRVIYDGTHLTPVGRHGERMRRELRLGVEITIERIVERSMRSHAHFHAVVADCWEQLGDQTYASPQHLRKRALIETGWATHSDTIFQSNADAQQGAVLAAMLDEFCVGEVRGRVLRVWRAVSQAVAAMEAEDFQRSKSDVLSYIGGLLQVSRSTLEKHAGKSA